MFRCLCFLLLASQLLLCQSLQNMRVTPERGFRPNASIPLTDIESIDPTTGNLSLTIPILALPPGRAGWSFPLSIQYNSAIYETKLSYRANDGNSPPTSLLTSDLSIRDGAGTPWSYSFEYELYTEMRPGSLDCVSEQSIKRYRNWIRMPDGSMKVLRLFASDNSSPLYRDIDGDGFYRYQHNRTDSCGGASLPSPAVWYTIDGSYIRLEHAGWTPACTSPSDVRWTLYFPDGRRITGGCSEKPNGFYDRNGNRVSLTYTSGTSAKAILTDDLGRHVDIQIGTFTEAYPDIITTSGFNGVELTAKVFRSAASISGGMYACTNGTLTPFENGLSCEICPRGDSVCLNRASGGRNVEALAIQNVTRIELPRPTPTSPLTAYSFKYNEVCSTSPCWGELRRMHFYTRQQEGDSQTTAEQNGTHYRVDYSYNATGVHRTNWTTYNAAPDILDNPITSRKLCFNGTCNGYTETTTYSVGDGVTTVTAPDSSQTISYFTHPRYMYPFRGLVHRIVQPGGNTIDRVWQRNKPYGSIYSFHPANPYIAVEVRGAGGGASPVQCAVLRRTIDKNGNVTKQEEFDWKNPSSNSCAAWATLSGLGVPLRSHTNKYYANTADAADSGDTPNEANAYWRAPTTTPRHFLQAVERSRTHVGDAGAVVAATYNTYDQPAGKGNRLTEAHWDSSLDTDGYTFSANNEESLTSANAQITTWAYTSYGDVQSITSPAGRITQFGYDSQNCRNSEIQGSSSSVQRTFSRTCDTSTGLPTYINDSDNGISNQIAYDNVGRVTGITEAKGSSSERQTTYVYDDATRKLTVKEDVAYSGDAALTSTHSFDGLGRLILTERSDPEGVIKTNRAYEYSGTQLYHWVSNPYRSGSEQTTGWTRTTLDPLGRPTSLVTTSGPTRPNTTPPINKRSETIVSYYGASTSVTDPAGRSRATTADALGRLVEVVEAGDTAATVKYCYDLLGNLTQVHYGTQTDRATLCQSVSPSRSFGYSSLSRLLSAFNPESGQTTYSYDRDGNLLTRTLQGGLTTCYGTFGNTGSCVSGYDALNRPQNKSYSDSTLPVVYAYDLATLGKGLLYSVTTVAPPQEPARRSQFRISAYDALGRPISSSQFMGQANDTWTEYPFSYTHYLNGALQSITYPSLRRIDYQLTGSRLTSITGTGNKTYLSDVKYWPDSAPNRFRIGTSSQLWQHLCRNEQGQTETVLLRSSEPSTACPAAADNEIFRLDYTHETRSNSVKAPDNNGNVLTQRIQRGGSVWNQAFTYDSRNRLLTAAESGSWNQGYAYDIHGNRAVVISESNYVPSQQNFTPTIPDRQTSLSTIYATSNRWSGNTYDGPGNVIATGSNAISLSYDAENRVKQSIVSTGSGDLITDYLYDGNGRRIARNQSGRRTTYVYDAFGRLASEIGSPISNPTQFLVSDNLGSTRLILNADGSSFRCHDYLPFGEEIQQGLYARGSCFGSGAYPASQDTNSLKFTGKERDAETGLDYFGARYMSAAQGRFTSPDPLLSSAHIASPQSWNRYAYTLNNPLRFTDPFGLYICNGTNAECKDFESSLKQVERARNSYKKGSAEYNALNGSLQAYGKKGVDNGVTVQFGATRSGGAGDANIGISIAAGTANKMVTADNPSGQNTVVTFDLSKHMSNGSVDIGSLAISAAHEGIHVGHGTALVGALPMDLTSSGAAGVLGGPLNLTKYATEFAAYSGSSYTAQGLGVGSLKIGGNFEIWNSGWKAVDVNTLRSNGINGVLSDPNGLYKVTPGAPGKKLIE